MPFSCSTDETEDDAGLLGVAPRRENASLRKRPQKKEAVASVMASTPNGFEDMQLAWLGCVATATPNEPFAVGRKMGK